ncbi:cytochrome P450 [Aspergillus parasiticus]|uniref:Cytochrome P450 n=1 Tax=Aspergillus parasiticus TaxID=5067 RepID=A0A5N6D7X4_ASPPA|nr:cytochrome P450 [Aspergillus parasiticus]
MLSLTPHDLKAYSIIIGISEALGPMAIVASYRLYFHPLHSFPGPKLAVITSLHEFYYAVIKDETDKSKGPIVRITPDELHIRDSSFYNEIYAGGSHMRDKSSSFVRFFVDHNHHQLRLLNMRPLIQGKIDTLMQHFGKAQKEQSVINLSITFSALNHCSLKDIGHLSEIETMIQVFGLFGYFFRLIPFYMPRIRCIPSKVMEKILLPSARVIKQTETTSWILSVTMFYLLNNKESPFRLYEELRYVMPQLNYVSNLPELETLPLLRAVIQEGLWLSFGVLTRLPRVAPIKALNSKGHIIPPGISTPVSQSICFVHMDPQHFLDPHTFNPERWLGTAEERKALESVLVPFPRGNRQCLGIKHVCSPHFFFLGLDLRTFSGDTNHAISRLGYFRPNFYGIPKINTVANYYELEVG